MFLNHKYINILKGYIDLLIFGTKNAVQAATGFEYESVSTARFAQCG
jgi:hypothetical protein